MCIAGLKVVSHADSTAIKCTNIQMCRSVMCHMLMHMCITATNTALQVSIYRSLLDITAGMDYLHSAGVMHGDLKGANVLLKSTATDPRGFQCKLADFGLSRMLDMDMTHISTHTYGTISYMPPELLSQGKMTRAADVYSFGMLSESTPHHPCNASHQAHCFCLFYVFRASAALVPHTHSSRQFCC